MNVSKENLIEGIGDEVLIVISLLLITFIVFLIWLSKDINCFPGYFRRILNQSPIEDNGNELDTNNEIIEEINETEVEDNLANIIEKDINVTEQINGDNQNNSIKSNEICPEGLISIKLKYLDDRTFIVFADPQSTISDFKRNNFQQDLSNNKTIRLIYNGRELKELNGEATLAGYGLAHNSTIHCLITARRDNQNTTQPTASENSIMSSGINIGSLMFPLFGFILSMIWYYRLNYKHHFNMISTFALIGITGMYFVSCFVSYSAPVQIVRGPLRETVDNLSH